MLRYADRLFLRLAFFFVITFSISSNAFAAQFTVFQKNYTRQTGKPKPVVDTFSVLNPQTQWLIKVSAEDESDDKAQKKDKDHGKDKDKDKEKNDHFDSKNVVILLNGREILRSPHHHKKHSPVIEADVTLEVSNTLSVEVRGEPGDEVKVRIIGVDRSEPVIKWISPLSGQISNVHNLSTTLQLEEDLSGLDPASLEILLDGVSVRDEYPALPAPTLYAALSTDLAVNEGPHSLTAKVKDLAGLSESTSVSFTIDRTPPVINNLVPADNSLLSSASPAISANYSDALSGIKLDSIQIVLDGANITPHANVTASGFQYISSNLLDGTHELQVLAMDTAGNVSQRTAHFMTDTAPPVISELLPADGTAVDNAQPDISAKYFDLASGIDLQSVHLKLDGADVTHLSLVTPTAISFTPASGLSAGAHTISLELKDKAGLSATASSTFTALTDPNLRDADDDGFSPSTGDCNDQNPSIHPNAFDAPTNGIDENCDGVDATIVPDLTGLTQAAAESQITGADLEIGTITSDNSDTVPAGKVISQDPPAAAIVPQGTTVSLMISLGPVSHLPPDPATVAPPLSKDSLTNFYDATSFLYTGDRPIQTGVQPNAIDPVRTAVLRGKILTKTGSPLSGVKVSILNHPELGETLSRLDGMFDLVVNGGGHVVVTYHKQHFLSSSRQIHVPWQDYVTLPDVVMIEPDPQVTSIDLTSPAEFQVARGSVISDPDGTRQGTVLIPQGTQAVMTFPDGSTQPLNTMNIRITEFTVGANGPEAMPAELPATSAYTYAFEINADEAVAAGADEIEFNKPLIYYVDDFLDFPAGIDVPVGSYDRNKGQWIPHRNGRVIKILNVENNIAQVDIDGSGNPANNQDLLSLGITFAERQKLASLYGPGKSVWRVEIPHFTQPWDLNWGIVPPDGAVAALLALLGIDPSTWDCWNKAYNASYIECQTQTLGEMIDVPGTPFSLNYRSDRVPGRRSLYTTQINVSKAPLPPSVKRIVVETSIAGQRHRQSFAPQNDLIVPFTWDGKDAFGRDLKSSQTATFRVGYVYDAVYGATSRFGYNGNGMVITGTRPGQGGGVLTRQELTLWQETTTVLGPLDSHIARLGGWSLNIHHTYDPVSRTVYYGNGERLKIVNEGVFKNSMVSLVHTGTVSLFDIGPDGSVYNYHHFDRVIQRVYRDGTSQIVAGGGNPPDGIGDGGPATSAALSVMAGGGLAVSDDGTIYIGEFYTPAGDSRVRRVTPDGIITTYAGGAPPEAGSPDGVPATQVHLSSINGLAVGPDGSLYISHYGHRKVRKVDPDGIISTIASDVGPYDIDVGPDGSVYFTDASAPANIPRIWRVPPFGPRIKVAATDCEATDVNCYQFWNGEFPFRLAVGEDQSIYFSGNTSGFGPSAVPGISRLSNGTLLRVAGTNLQNASESGLATQVRVSANFIAFHPDGDLYYLESPGVKKISAPLPNFQIGTVPIASEDGSEIYIIDEAGRHLRTVSALTGITLYQFAYDANGLKTITDRDGNVTTIERDSAGNPTAIVGPFGQRTALHVDANGYLDKVVHSNGDTYQMVTTSDGLLKEFINPRNNVSKFSYDSLGRLTRDENPLGGAFTVAREEISEGFKVTLKDALNRPTIYQEKFLENGEEHRLTTYPDGTQNSLVLRSDYSSSSIEADGTTREVVQMADQRFGMQSPLLQSQTTRTPGGLVSTISTSRTTALSNPQDFLSVVGQTESVRINGKTFLTAYDAATRTRTVNTPEGRFNTLEYDTREHLTKVQHAFFSPINYSYDPQGRLVRTVQGTGTGQRTLDLVYNLQGFLESATNSLNEKVSYEYDLKGRVLRQTLPDGRFIQYTYDGNDNVISITPPGRPRHEFIYTALDQVGNYVPPVVAPGGQTTYLYNPARQLTGITRPDGQEITYSYDAAGRLSVLTSPTGQTVYSYSPSTGNLTKTTAPDGGTLEYTYDGSLPLSEKWGGVVQGTVSQTYNNDLRIVSQSVNGGSTVGFVYDNDGLLTQAGSLNISRDGFSGYLTGTTLGSIATSFGYNNFGELSADSAKYSGTVYLEHQYGYDKVGRIVSRSETDQSQTDQYEYTYDLAGRLTDVKKNNVAVSHYEYDSNGNRLSRSASGATESGTYDAQDRLLTYGNLSYTYTANGELKSKTDTSNGETTQYIYDVFGNLLKVILPDGKVIDYVIDGNDRRIGKKVNGTLVQGFLYEDDLSPVAELDSSNNIVSRFVYGTRVNVPDYMLKAGKTYRFVTDHLGSVRMVVDISDGSIAQRIEYDEFGRVLNDTNPGFQPFGFAGGMYDSQTSLVRFGARDYDALTGRWTSKDPIGFGGGDTNLYGYVVNDPVNKFDPFGLFKFGRRPLQSTPWLKPNNFYRDPIENHINHEPFHEHGFFEDGSGDNFGYNGTDGIFSEDPNGKGYVYDDTHYDDDIMREALNNLKKDPRWLPDKYKLMGFKHHNCQDFAEAWRAEYDKIKKTRSNAESTQK